MQPRQVGSEALPVATPRGVSTPALELLQRTAQRVGLPLHVLGLGERYTGFGMKLTALDEWIRGQRNASDSNDDSGYTCSSGSACSGTGTGRLELERDDVVMYIDAFDVLLLPPAAPRRLLQTLQSIEFGHRRAHTGIDLSEILLREPAVDRRSGNAFILQFNVFQCE